MSGKRQFGLDRKDSDFFSFPSFSGSIARENKSGLRKIHLARQRLHLGITQSTTIRKNRQRIAFEWCLREYIKLNEFVSAIRHRTSSICAKNGKTERTFIFPGKNFRQNS